MPAHSLTAIYYGNLNVGELHFLTYTSRGHAKYMYSPRSTRSLFSFLHVFCVLRGDNFFCSETSRNIFVHWNGGAYLQCTDRVDGLMLGVIACYELDYRAFNTDKNPAQSGIFFSENHLNPKENSMKIFTCNKLVPITFAVMTTFPIHAAEKFITLASTTSTQASGFFDYYLPLFKSKTGIEVQVVAVGTGQALKLGESGDADVLLVHDKIGEQAFIRKGYGVDRREVMYNDFIIVGPKDDPATINESKDAVTALKKIAHSNAVFISRGDDSGTHRKELRLWKEASIDPELSGHTWYKQAGAGMGAVLNMASSMNAYTISDRATWINFANRGNLDILMEGDPPLFNQYALMLVNPERNTHVKQKEAAIFMDWMTEQEGQKLIAEFKLGGKVLFHPNAR